MANIKGAEKRARQSLKRRARNRSEKAIIAALGKKLLGAVAAKDKTKSAESFNAYSSALDKAVKKGIIMANAASRGKSRAAKKIDAIKQ